MQKYIPYKKLFIIVLFFVASAGLVGASYFFTVDITISIGENTINGPDTLDAGDGYGWSVVNMGDLDGNGVDDLAVGAYQDEGTTNTGSGVVYIHLFDDQGGIIATSRIDEDVVAGIDNSDGYGWSIANMGDLDGNGVNDIAVGAALDEAGATPNLGAVYIHLLSYTPTTVSVLSTLKMGEGTTGVTGLDFLDWYGSYVFNMGDLDGNGVNDIAVGAYADEAGATSNAGAVYLHFLDYTTPNLTVQSTMKIGEGATGLTGLDANDEYGKVVAPLGDIDGNGTGDIAVSAYRDEYGANSDTGAVYIHLLDHGTQSVASTVKIGQNTTGLSGLEFQDGYGQALVNVGDLDSNGVNDIAVGALLGESGGATSDTGVVYIHLLDSSGAVIATTLNAKNKVPELDTNDLYGNTLYAPGDISGDGVPDLFVGAIEFGSGPGTTYVHTLDTTGAITSTGILGDDEITTLTNGRYGTALTILSGFAGGYDGFVSSGTSYAFGATTNTGATFLHIGEIGFDQPAPRSTVGNSRLRSMLVYKRWLEQQNMPVMNLPRVAVENVACPYFTGYARQGDRDENTGGTISRLQDFLTRQGYALGLIDGIFGTKTHAAVSAWQYAFAHEILWPWRIVASDTASLGRFYKTSRRAAHWQVGCPAESVVLDNGTVLPELPSWR